MVKQKSILLPLILLLILAGGTYYFFYQEIHTEEVIENNALPVPANLTWEQLVARHENELLDPVNTTIYSCDEGLSFLARVEVRDGGGDKAEVFLKDGTKLLLARAISGSGVRYTNKGGSFEFWNKGDTAFIQEGGQIIFANCIAED